MQIRGKTGILQPDSVESIPLEDVVVLVDRAGVAIGVQPTFSARVGGVGDRGSTINASRWVEIPIVGSNGEVSGVLCHSRRGTSAGCAIAASDRGNVSATTDVLPSIAHDINSLFAVIGGGLWLLACESDAGYRNVIVGEREEAITRGLLLSQQLLDPVRPKSIDELITGSRLRVIAGTLELALGPDISVRVEIAPDLWAFNADSEELYFALLNLCRNSADAMPHGGVITVAARNVEQVSAATRRFVEIVVVDDGEGMSEEILSQALIPYFTTKPPCSASGLGLTEVQRFADARDGAIRIESKPGVGTLVRIFLPRADATEPPRLVVDTEIAYSPTPEGGVFRVINRALAAPTS
ncbi:ATP-binding protein [Bradyrhizobium sp. LHD-71]|uniref:ATP-binding protein n=1 Tax=Bradyrhizobium sp. LHD-71 TaxID=3072141 RepID=UPI00280EE198|nr:ATP-binding protein [Bradyrhizobium sp. LHD-71]MDQ8727626.1 ATP-binding protein [Bradyrhizobium sp. LHD-71]